MVQIKIIHNNESQLSYDVIYGSMPGFRKIVDVIYYGPCYGVHKTESMVEWRD